MVELCLVGVKQGQEDKVLALWDRIRNDYGNDNVAADAYNIVEPCSFAVASDNLPAAVGLDGDEIEQRIFESASYLALENRCKEALPRLEEYIGNTLPVAHFEAQFYTETASLSKKPEEAYAAYVAVLAMPAGEFTEASHWVPPPSRGMPETTERPWATTRPSKKWPCSRPTDWKLPSVKCAVTISSDKKTSR